MKKQKIFDITSMKIAFIIWVVIHISKWPDIILTTGNISQIVISKISHLGFLYFIINNIKRLIINRKEKKTRNEIIIAITFFTIAFVTLLLVWPGIWTWDDTVILKSALSYDFNPWQHFFSGLFYILCLQTLPFNTGILIMQILIASMIVGYCIANVIDVLNIKEKRNKIIIGILLFIPTILPPVMEHILAGYRMGMYSFFELFLIAEIFIYYQRKEKIEIKELIYLSLLTIIVASWRTEAIYYIIAFPIILLLYGKKIISLKKIIISTIAVAICVVSLNKYNNYLIGDNNYSITATIMPVAELVKVADKEMDKDNLEKINQVIDISVIYDEPDKTGEEYFWGGITRKNYTKEDYSNYLKSYMSLAVKYPGVVAKSMLKLFRDSAGIGVTDGYTRMRSEDNSSNIYSDRSGEDWEYTNSKLRAPISKEVRSTVIRWIANKKADNKVTFMYYLNWNLLIPLALLAITTVMLLIKKEWLLCFTGCVIIGRVILVFLTASAPYFMYYLSVYLVGYVFSVLGIYKLIKDKKLIEQNKGVK